MVNNLCSDWLQTSIFQILAASTWKNYSNMPPAGSWDWMSLECQQCFALHLGNFMFWLVADIHLSDIGSLYWEQIQWHAPCSIGRMSINQAVMNISFAFWVICFLISCRYSFIRYLQPLLAKTTATCSLPYPENKHPWSVVCFSCYIFRNQGIVQSPAFLTRTLTALIGNNTIYTRSKTNFKLMDIASCIPCKNILLVVENAIVIIYY
jgi:hypothetical protein